VPHIDLQEPCCFTKFPDGPQIYTLDVLWLQEGRAQIHMSEWSQSFTLTRMWAEFSSSAPHLLHSVLSDSPIRWRCLLRVLCPVRRPLTALDCVLLKDRNLALAPKQGPKINSRACLWVSPGPHKMPDWINRWINKFRAVLTSITAVNSRIVHPLHKQCNGLQSWEGERRRNYGQAHTLRRPEFAQAKKNALLGDKCFINLIFAVSYTSLA
jgi:hypothetical protein